MILSIVLVTISYLMGSICSAVIICRLFSLPDPRTKGSRNPGATNVLRIAGKQYALIVMIMDMLKGTIPVLIAQAFDVTPTVVAFTALAAVIGHMFPIFFQFKGGKGVATAIGALFGFQIVIGALVAATWVVVAKFSRYASLASLVAIFAAPLYTMMLIRDIGVFPPLFFMALLIVYKHRDNITRLVDGTESKIRLKENMLEDVLEPPPESTNDFSEGVGVVKLVKAEDKPAKVEVKVTAKKTKTTKTLTTKVAAKATEPKKSVEIKKPTKTKKAPAPKAKTPAKPKPKAKPKTTKAPKTPKAE